MSGIDRDAKRLKVFRDKLTNIREENERCKNKYNFIRCRETSLKSIIKRTVSKYTDLGYFYLNGEETLIRLENQISNSECYNYNYNSSSFIIYHKKEDRYVEFRFTPERHTSKNIKYCLEILRGKDGTPEYRGMLTYEEDGSDYDWFLNYEYDGVSSGHLNQDKVELLLAEMYFILS